MNYSIDLENITKFYDVTNSTCMLKNNIIDVQCVYSEICGQINHHFLKIGIYLVIGIIIVTWLKSWYLKKGYLKYPVKNNKYFGDINRFETRIYWDSFIDQRIIRVCIGYILVVIFLTFNIV